MGWMLVPLTQYHGGGQAATIEPLHEHRDHYAHRLANLFGAGVQACYRGHQIYDTDETKTVVKKWVDFYKAHRAILDSDIIHLRRADGRDLDYILHVNPQISEKGLLMIYNPRDEAVTRKLTIPLYYTGLTDSARMLTDDTAQTVKLNDHQDATIEITVPARGNLPVIFVAVARLSGRGKETAPCCQQR